MRALIGAILVGAACTACGSEDGSEGGSDFEISGAPLAGVIAGQAWTLGTAETNAFLSADSGEFWVDLYAQSFAACTGAAPFDGNHLIASIPKAAGDYSLSLSLNATFVVEGAAQTENLVAIRGRIIVDEVTDALVRGGVHIEYDASHRVNGRFEASICPE
jgi:hypothetical protein